MVEHVESVLKNEQRTVVLLQILVSKLQGFHSQSACIHHLSLGIACMNAHTLDDDHVKNFHRTARSNALRPAVLQIIRRRFC